MNDSIVVSLKAKDFVAAGSGTVGVDPAYSNLQTSKGATGYVEWKVTLPATGKWRLHVEMTSAVERPCALTLNGEKQDGSILAEVTGGWQSDRLRCFVYGPYDFQSGENLLRIDFTSGEPHLSQFGFSKVESLDLLLPWIAVPGAEGLASIAVLSDGTLLGIGTDKTLRLGGRAEALSGLLRKEPFTPEWSPVADSAEVLSATELSDGTLVAAFADHFLRVRATPASPWVEVPQSGAVISVTQLSDGTFLGVGVDKQLYTRATLSSPWVAIPKSGDVLCAIELSDGTLLGVGVDKQLYTRATFSSPWTLFPTSGDIVSVVELPDGALAFVKSDGGLALAARVAPADTTQTTLPQALRSSSIAATGLEDYGYWLHWMRSLPAQAKHRGKPYRRGLVWR